MKRIEAKFKQLKEQNKTAFVGYICAGDPNYETSLEIFKAMPKSGVDIIELGVPFLDPSGDGPIIQSASKRAVENGATLETTLKMVEEFRKTNQETPVILMSYYNPIFKFGLNKIFAQAKEVGVDGFLIVDLPFEEEREISQEMRNSDLDLIKLIAPTTDEARIAKITENASGFLYLISMLGITGTKDANSQENISALKIIRKNSNVPVVIGFGIKNAETASQFAKIGADGVVVGSKIVDEINQAAIGDNSVEKIVASASECLEGFAQALK